MVTPVDRSSFAYSLVCNNHRNLEKSLLCEGRKGLSELIKLKAFARHYLNLHHSLSFFPHSQLRLIRVEIIKGLTNLLKTMPAFSKN